MSAKAQNSSATTPNTTFFPFFSTNARNASPALLFELADKQRELVVHWSSMVALQRYHQVRNVLAENTLFTLILDCKKTTKPDLQPSRTTSTSTLPWLTSSNQNFSAVTTNSKTYSSTPSTTVSTLTQLRGTFGS